MAWENTKKGDLYEGAYCHVLTHANVYYQLVWDLNNTRVQLDHKVLINDE